MKGSKIDRPRFVPLKLLKLSCLHLWMPGMSILEIQKNCAKLTFVLSGRDLNKNVMYGTVNEISPAEATFTDVLTYDVNGDGKADLLDITEAQLYYRADNDSADWDAASKCAFNGYNIIDIEDYMAIWLNFTK